MRLTLCATLALSFVGVGFAWSSYAFSQNVMFEAADPWSAPTTTFFFVGFLLSTFIGALAYSELMKIDKAFHAEIEGSAHTGRVTVLRSLTKVLG